MFVVILGMVIDAYMAVYSMYLKHFIYKQTLDNHQGQTQASVPYPRTGVGNEPSSSGATTK